MRALRRAGLVAAIVFLSVVPSVFATTLDTGAIVGGAGTVEGIFSASGGTLTVDLIYLTGTVSSNPDVLTAILFTVAGSPALTPGTASILGGSSLVDCGTAAQCSADLLNLGGNYQYKQTVNIVQGQSYGGTISPFSFSGEGISGVGLGIFGSGNFSPETSSEPLDGVGYGVVSPSTTTFTGGFGNNGPYVRNQIEFTLTGWGGLDPSTAISDVVFLFGSALNEGSACFGPSCTCTGPNCFPFVPEPTTLVLLGVGVLGAGVARRFRKR